MSKKIVKKRKYISTPEKMWELFLMYRKWVKENPIEIEDYVGKEAIRVMRQKPRCLTLEGFENFVAEIDKMPKDLGDYFENRDGRYEDYVAICSRIKRIIRQDQIEGGMANIYNASITQRLNNLAEKRELDHTSKGEKITNSWDLSKLTNEEVDTLLKLQEKMSNEEQT